MAMLSRRERTEATRASTEAALLAATVDLLGAGAPFAELSVEQIVRRAGFSRPTFYTYFRDKRELILRLGVVLRDAVAEAADPWLTATSPQSKAMLRATLIGVLRAYGDHRETLAAIREAATYDPEVTVFWREFNERFIARATERIIHGPDNPDGAHASARAYVLVWMTERTLSEHVADPTRAEDALIDELTEAWSHGTGP